MLVNKKNKQKQIISFICGFVVMALIIAVFVLKPTKTPDKMQYTEFLNLVEKEKVDSVIYDPEGKFITFTEKEKTYITDNPHKDTFKEDMLLHNIEVIESNKTIAQERSVAMLMQILLYGMLFGSLFVLFRMQTGGPENTHVETESVKTFEDVAGLEEVKESLLTVVDMLKNTEKYKSAGARIPKGVLLAGPPGTGKTLLAKAVAGEAGVNFLATSGSDFDNKFVGVGADKMRKLFKNAKKMAPCILFIDEIDAVGTRRSFEDTAYSRQTLNQLLSCMDGFSEASGITVFAATNAIESLDPALLRPGRFDARFMVDLPATSKDRKAIIDLYLKNKKVDETFSVDALAKQTIGQSPAAIEVILNEAAIEAVKENNGIISQTNVNNAFYRQVTNSHIKKDGNREYDETHINTVAYHEAAHALVGYLEGEEITQISIVPSTAGSGGMTMMAQKKLGMYTKKELESKIKMAYAGRNAEILINGAENVSSGAVQDITAATRIIREMVNHYGMSACGLLDMDELNLNATDMLKVYQAIASRLEKESMSIVEHEMNTLHAIAAALKEKETLSENEFIQIVQSQKSKSEIHN